MYFRLFLSPSASLSSKEIPSHFGPCSQRVAQILSDEDCPTENINWCASLHSRWFARRWCCWALAFLCVLCCRGRPSCGTSSVVSLVEEMRSFVFCIFTHTKIVCSLGGWGRPHILLTRSVIECWLYLEGWHENR